MAKVRLFVALELPKAVRSELARVVDLLRGSVADAKWVPTENLHLTLSFIGWAQEEQVPTISEAVSGAVEDHVDFVTRLTEMGAFPTHRRARVVWAGLDDAAGGLAGLASSVCDAVASLGFRQEERPFRAHVTLARLRTPRPVDFAGSELQPILVPVERVTLFQSHLGRPTPRYESIATFPFRRT